MANYMKTKKPPRNGEALVRADIGKKLAASVAKAMVKPHGPTLSLAARVADLDVQVAALTKTIAALKRARAIRRLALG